MRVMLDTNVLISAFLFPGKSIDKLINLIFEKYKLVLSSSVIEEVKGVIEYKFPHRSYAVDNFFASLTYEYQHDFHTPEQDKIDIRDPDDRKIIAAALAAQVDVLVTGDNDFFDRQYGDLEIMKPSAFLEKYK